MRLGFIASQDRGPRQTEILLRFKNTPERGLGAPLPEGTVRVMAPRKTGIFYIGADSKKDTAVGLDWELAVGASSAVTARPRLIARNETKLRDGRVRVVDQIEIDIANALPQATVLELQQAPLGANLKVTRTSADWRLKDGDVTWSIAMPARGAVQLRYALSYVRG